MWHTMMTGHRAYHRALINSLYRELYPAQNILRPQRLLPVLCGWWWVGHLWPIIKAYCAGKESLIGASHLPLLYPLGLAPTLQKMDSLLKARDTLHGGPYPRLQASPVSTCCGGCQYTVAAAWSWEMRFSPCQEAGQKQFTMVRQKQHAARGV